jgi:glycosyltransferase involved in cell wall biosynthesis
MNKPNVLCLSLRTPPAVRPQAILIGKMIPEWIRQGLKPVIVTYDDNGTWDIETPLYKIKPPKSRGGIWTLPILRDIDNALYVYTTCKNIVPIIKKHQIELIYSFANPQICNIIGAKLKKLTGVKLISNFSDPWYDQPYDQYSFWSRYLILRQERSVIVASDRVVFVNQVLRNLVMKKYPEAWFKKTFIIPHCFDAKQLPPEIKKDASIFTFSHIGTFYEKRTPEIIFKAFRHLLDSNKQIPRFKLKLIGPIREYATYGAEKLSDLIKRYRLNSHVEVVAPISHLDSLVCMKQADYLIAIDADIPNSPFLQSKIIDYAGSGTPFIGITPSGSPMNWFMKNLRYPVFDYSQFEQLEKQIERCINRKSEASPDKNFLSLFDVAQTTKQLINLFQSSVDD